MGNEAIPVGQKSEKSSQELPFTIEPEPSISAPKRGETRDTLQSATTFKTPEAVRTDASPSFEDLGELPPDYQTGDVYLAARDPHWLFVYWDLNLESVDRRIMLGDEPNIYLKVFKGNGDLVDQIRVNSQARNWYFPITEAGVEYFVELGFYDLASKWAVLGQSNQTLAPADTFSEGMAEFASVPFHLSFEKMLQTVESDLSHGSSLVGALSRLQSVEDKSIREIAKVWTEDQKRILETLVGPDLVSQISLGSSEGDETIRQKLGEALTAALSLPGGSELSFLKDLSQSPSSESSISSGFGASWSMAPGGETSWLAALGSSWSGQPFGAPHRDFFMHVNAEVIFYGGTHPDATVWIDGAEIPLTADGTFRYHFRLPDGEFEIPIVAESPDGVEIRSAKLVFKRGTSRTGNVGATPQPTYLRPPIGSV